MLAAWQTIGGCGAGSSTGIGGIKWVGRNVRGGLVNVQCQANYTKLPDGYVYAVNNQLTVDLFERFSVGVVVPYLYKWIDDPVKAGFDVSNGGLGDVNALVTARLGPTSATALTLSVGFPTGTHDASYNMGNKLPQDRQLGPGTLSAALMADHTIDNLWGPIVLGGAASYPGAENDLENYRSPSATLYGFVGYLLGPVVPAFGLSATGFLTQDRDRGQPNEDRPPFMASVNASLEWSNDWVALLAGFSLPFSLGGLQPWTAGLGVSLAPF